MVTAGLVPIIDFGPFLSGQSQGAKDATAQELLRAMKEVGFVMLTGFYASPVSKELVEEAFVQVCTSASVPDTQLTCPPLLALDESVFRAVG